MFALSDEIINSTKDYINRICDRFLKGLSTKEFRALQKFLFSNNPSHLPRRLNALKEFFNNPKEKCFHGNKELGESEYLEIKYIARYQLLTRVLDHLRNTTPVLSPENSQWMNETLVDLKQEEQRLLGSREIKQGSYVRALWKLICGIALFALMGTYLGK